MEGWKNLYTRGRIQWSLGILRVINKTTKKNTLPAEGSRHVSISIFYHIQTPPKTFPHDTPSKTNMSPKKGAISKRKVVSSSKKKSRDIQRLNSSCFPGQNVWTRFRGISLGFASIVTFQQIQQVPAMVHGLGRLGQVIVPLEMVAKAYISNVVIIIWNIYIYMISPLISIDILLCTYASTYSLY